MGAALWPRNCEPRSFEILHSANSRIVPRFPFLPPRSDGISKLQVKRKGQTHICVSGIDIQSFSCVRRLGHPEEDQDKRQGKSTTHSVQRDTIRTVLDNCSSCMLRVSMARQDYEPLGHPPIGTARLMPPKTPRLNTAVRKPRSCTNLVAASEIFRSSPSQRQMSYQISAIDAGTSASIGAMQRPQKTLAATKERKLFASAAQKHDTISPRVVPR